MEILVTLLITALFSTAVYAVFLRSIVDAQRIHRSAETTRLGHAILRLIEQDLAAAAAAGEEIPHFVGSPGPEDSSMLTLLCATDSRALQEESASDLVEVTYMASAGETPGLLKLYRKETFEAGRTLPGTDRYRLLDDRVRTFRLSYYDGAGWLDVWTEPGVPRAVCVELELDRTIQTASHRSADTQTFSFEIVAAVPAGG